MSEDNRLPGTSCLQCGTELNGATPMDGESKPHEGDTTLCLYCGHVMKFSPTLQLCELSGQEMIAVMQNPEVQTALRTITKFHKEYFKHKG